MKKQKIFLSLIVLFGIIFIPFFTGCGEISIRKSLPAPASVEYKVNLDTGKQIIYTQENPLASGYIFGISEIETEDETEFLQYRSDKNYFDVSEMFLNAKTYYFYAKYLGGEKYDTSKISPINSKSIEQPLTVPFITLTETTLNWVAIDNADNYLIYCKYADVVEPVSSTHQTSFDLSSYIEQKQNLKQELNFYIVATARANYTKSADSNIVTYSSFLQLSVPQNISVNKTNNRFYIQWKKVDNCENYIIKANLTNIIEVSITDCIVDEDIVKYDITNIFNEYGLGEYKFQIKSAKTNNFLPSEFSEVYFYTNNQKLQTPQNVTISNLNGSVNISWSHVYISYNPNIVVEEYELWISDVNDDFKLKRFYINKDGVQGIITSNSVNITYADLGITDYNQIDNANFKISVVAKQFGYLDSNKSTYFIIIGLDYTVDAPVIVDDDANKTISWEAVDRAELYRVVVSHDTLIEQFVTSNTYFPYLSCLTQTGTYYIKCLSITKEGYTSEYSNVIEKQVYKQLETPKIVGIYANNDKFVIDFNEVENATSYSLYIGNKLISNAITIDNNTILILDAMKYKQNGLISFQLMSNSNQYYMASAKSEIYNVKTKLSTPFIKVQGNYIVWDDVVNATEFELYLDDKNTPIESAISSINLIEYIDINVARKIMIKAKSKYFEDSDLSNQVYFNRVDQQIDGYTDKYFYFGQTYDYYITDEQEMMDVVEYSTINFLDTINIYVNFDVESTIYEKLQIAVNKRPGTYNFSHDVDNRSKKIGKSTLIFDYATLSPEPDYEPANTQYDKAMLYSIEESSRDSSHEFVTDTYLVSQDVYSTDGLISALEHHAVPKFKYQNSVAELIYNKAKELLIEICDDSMNDYYKALAIHDYIIQHVYYDYECLNRCDNHNAPYNEMINRNEYVNPKMLWIGYCHFVESAMLYNLAVCDGYAKMYSLLCNLEGIDCLVISGSIKTKLNDGTEYDYGHAWNKLMFDIDGDGSKECFAVDCTHDDPSSNSQNGYEYAVHEYFLVPDSVLVGRSENQWKHYPQTTEETDMFYSAYQYTPYNLPLKIDNIMQASQYLMYLSSDESVVVEGLVSKVLWDQMWDQIKQYMVGIKYLKSNSIYDDYYLMVMYK